MIEGVRAGEAIIKELNQDKTGREQSKGQSELIEIEDFLTDQTRIYQNELARAIANPDPNRVLLVPE